MGMGLAVRMTQCVGQQAGRAQYRADATRVIGNDEASGYYEERHAPPTTLSRSGKALDGLKPRGAGFPNVLEEVPVDCRRTPEDAAVIRGQRAKQGGWYTWSWQLNPVEPHLEESRKSGGKGVLHLE